MTVGIDDTDFVMLDAFPGPVTNGANPSDWTTYSDSEDFPVGTKRAVYDSTNKGWAILMYAKIDGGTKGAASGSAIKRILGLDTTSAATGYSYVVTPDSSETILNGPFGIQLGTITAAQFTAGAMYGWIWVGGVCPVAVITGLDGTYASDGNVAAGSGIDFADNSDVGYFGVIGAADVGVVSAFALASDSNIS